MEEKPVRGINVLRKIKRRRAKGIAPNEAIAWRDPVYPISAERELARATLAYTDMVINTTQPYIDRLMRQYEDRSYRQDDAGDFISAVRGHKFSAAEKLSRKTGAMAAVEKGYKFSGELAKKHSINSWNDQVKDALGVQVNKDWYSDNMEDMVGNWIRQNVSKIQSIPSEYLTEVENIIRWGHDKIGRASCRERVCCAV